MANEEEKTVMKTNGNDKASADESKSTKTGGYRKLFLIGGLGGGAVVLGVVLGLFIIRPMTSDSGSESVGTANVKESKHESKATNEHEKPKKGKSGHDSSSGIYTIRDIVINPAGTGGTRFLSVSFAFDLESTKLESKFIEREAVIRDALITILSSKTVAQLTDPKQKEIVRYQIKKRVSDLMKTDELAGVYYTDFVLQ